MLPDFPKTKKKLHQLFTLDMRLFQEEQAPVYKMASKHLIIEGDESLHIYEDGNQKETEFNKCRDGFEIDYRKPENMTLEAVHEKFMNMTENLTKEMCSKIFDTIHKTTKETGNILDAEKKEFTVDHCLKALSMISIDFDKKMNPILPTFFIGSGLTDKIKVELEKLKEEPYKSQYEEIITQKKAEFIERESNRKLVD